MGTSLFVFLWRILNLYHCYYQNVLCRQSIAYVFSLIKKKSTFWILLPSVEYHCAGLWDIAVISSAQDHQAVCLDMVWSGPWRGALGVWECLAEHWSSLRVSGGGWSVEAGRRPHSWDPRRESIVPDHPWAASASAHWITEDLPPTGSFFFFLVIWSFGTTVFEELISSFLAFETFVWHDLILSQYSALLFCIFLCWALRNHVL